MKLTTKVRRQRETNVQVKLAFGLGALSILSTTTLNAEGFRDATIGAFDLGRSGGRIAQVDDATAVQNNPANLVNITNVVVELDPSVIYISANYQAPNGQTASTIHPLKLLPDFFLAAPIIKNQLTFGLGVTVPFGLANQWNNSSSAF